jgi:hypothetical protein
MGPYGLHAIVAAMLALFVAFIHVFKLHKLLLSAVK